MNRTSRSRRGFSLVELLAVVLVLAVLAAVAIPLYTSQRQSAAARTCKANIAAISAALAGYALRNGAYPADLTPLVGAPEGLTSVPTCPLGDNGTAGNKVYTYAVAAGAATLTCKNAAAHVPYGGAGAAAADNLP